ncbi:YceD family protein [uncultured Umboniibacter sp.]|uniref:YceD family protein n=1 Tax=uncultured Umboniibacter sp. TaxID=1798917 RepID=UPI002622DF15|nr:YceD family protein [uncultured Umboniibacter sp.]
MSEEQLNRQLPDHVDGRKMADHDVCLEGFVPVAKLERLDTMTREAGDLLPVTATFRRNEARHRWLHLEMRSELTIECQRCLEGYRYPIEVDCEVMLVRDDEIAKIVPRHVEPVVLDDDAVSIWEVLSDEILLVLPQVSQHDVEHCQGSASFELGPGKADASVELDVENPFSVLAKLKK